MTASGVTVVSWATLSEALDKREMAKKMRLSMGQVCAAQAYEVQPAYPVWCNAGFKRGAFEHPWLGPAFGPLRHVP